MRARPCIHLQAVFALLRSRRADGRVVIRPTDRSHTPKNKMEPPPATAHAGPNHQFYAAAIRLQTSTTAEPGEAVPAGRPGLSTTTKQIQNLWTGKPAITTRVDFDGTVDDFHVSFGGRTSFDCEKEPSSCLIDCTFSSECQLRCSPPLVCRPPARAAARLHPVAVPVRPLLCRLECWAPRGHACRAVWSTGGG